jgi:putative lipase involved disintegration of autophagic bodies
MQAAFKIIHFLTTNLFHHVKEPIDSSWVGSNIDIRTKSMYIQAEQHILNLITTNPRKKKLFITGHSLGGALSTGKHLLVMDVMFC